MSQNGSYCQVTLRKIAEQQRRNLQRVGRRTPFVVFVIIKPLTSNDPYRGRTAPLTSKVAFYVIYSTNIGTEYFKHVIYSPFFSLQNAVCFIILMCLVPVLFTFYIQGMLNLKK